MSVNKKEVFLMSEIYDRPLCVLIFGINVALVLFFPNNHWSSLFPIYLVFLILVTCGVFFSSKFNNFEEKESATDLLQRETVSFSELYKDEAASIVFAVASTIIWFAFSVYFFENHAVLINYRYGVAVAISLFCLISVFVFFSKIIIGRKKYKGSKVKFFLGIYGLTCIAFNIAPNILF